MTDTKLRELCEVHGIGAGSEGMTVAQAMAVMTLARAVAREAAAEALDEAVDGWVSETMSPLINSVRARAAALRREA